MKTFAITTAFAATAVVVAVAAPVASADDPAPHHLGQPAELSDGTVVQAWTVTDLKASSDTIPYPVAGTLWEATATDEARQGAVTPIVSNFNARARSGETYRVLFGVATPQGVNPSTLAQGEKTTGKIYFDVTGDAPDSVVYNAGGQDLLLWVQPPPQARQSAPTRYQPSQAPAESTATATPSATPSPSAGPSPSASPTESPAPSASPTESPVPAPQGSSGTPLPEGSSGTPLPEGSAGTPAPAAAGTPTSTVVVPAPAG